jgi:hypothetical protein
LKGLFERILNTLIEFWGFLISTLIFLCVTKPIFLTKICFLFILFSFLFFDCHLADGALGDCAASQFVSFSAHPVFEPQ